MKKTVFLAISYTRRQKVEKLITKFFEDKGFDVRTGRDIRSGMPIGEEIIRIIKSCDFGIVVYNELRHNISYEWGLMDAILGKTGHIFLFKDENIHIDLVNELSDKNNINFTPFYGEDSENEIIKSLEEDKGLMDMIKECIRETISNERTPEVSDLADTIISYDIPLKKLQAESKELQIESKIRKEDARDLEEKFENIKDLTAEGHFYKSSAHYHAGQYEKAEEEIRKVIELEQDVASAYENLGVILFKLGREEEAVAELKKAIGLDPENAYTHSNLGIILFKLNCNEEAELEFRRAIGLDPENELFHSLLGSLLLKIGDYENAEIELKKAINLNPNSSMAHGVLGLLFAQLGRNEDAELKFKEDIRLNPGDIEALINYTFFLIQMKRYEEAKIESKVALSIDPNNSRAHCNKALLLSELNNNEDAELEFRESLSLDPENTSARAAFAIFLSKLCRYSDAASEYEKYLILKPYDSNIHNSRGLMLLYLGRYKEAELEYKKAIELDPENYGVYLNLSELHIIRGDYGESCNIAEKGLKSSELKDKIVSKSLITINKILLMKKSDKKGFFQFLKDNNGYELNFEFETLKKALKESEHYEEIEELIDEVKKCSKNK